MPLTPDELRDAINKTCPKCAAGNVPRFRPETGEFVHDFSTVDKEARRGTFQHSFCLATGLRKAFPSV